MRHAFAQARKFASFCLIAFLAILLAQMTAPSLHGQNAPANSAGNNDDAKLFPGTWRMVSDTNIGVMIYDNLGNMAVQVMPKAARPPYAAAQPTPDEAKAAITGYLAYFGTYVVDPRAHTVIHHRLGSLAPGDLGKDAVRHYEFGPTNDHLVLVPVDSGNHIAWDRAK